MEVHPALKQKFFGMAKELWKVTFAYAGFIDARECIKDLQEKGFSKDSPQYYPLLVGLVCLYARPFTTAEEIGPRAPKPTKVAAIANWGAAVSQGETLKKEYSTE